MDRGAIPVACLSGCGGGMRGWWCQMRWSRQMRCWSRVPCQKVSYSRVNGHRSHFVQRDPSAVNDFHGVIQYVRKRWLGDIKDIIHSTFQTDSFHRFRWEGNACLFLDFSFRTFQRGLFGVGVALWKRPDTRTTTLDHRIAAACRLVDS